jgi:tyrosine-protein phosphatase YwqE
MKFNVDYSLNLGENLQTFYSLLQEEDFNFKTKNIDVLFSIINDKLLIQVTCNSLIDLKIGTTAVQKSLDIIEKTLAI